MTGARGTSGNQACRCTGTKLPVGNPGPAARPLSVGSFSSRGATALDSAKARTSAGATPGFINTGTDGMVRSVYSPRFGSKQLKGIEGVVRGASDSGTRM